ncbi:MAG: hypothetical protein M1832_004785 [Thelocarpon impressellum]|nr:MAG: hypothetical protein M1832_004785 [Thelocarpon impressellum]
MPSLSSLFFVGAALAQLSLVSSTPRPWKRSLDSAITIEKPIALEGVLKNIGSDGSLAGGAGRGIIIASPSKENPDYFFTWTRDSALTIKALIDEFLVEYSPQLQTEIQDYISSQAVIQNIGNPSGGLTIDGQGLGEPKFEVGPGEFRGSWGRPQRDGPALRATALIAYARWLIDNGYKSTAGFVVWPIIRNDLTYVAEYWNQTGFDLWEEVRGSSFYTMAAQHRALVEGSALARELETTCDQCDSQAPQVLCFLQSFWDPSQKLIRANINVENGRSTKDTATLLAAIHTFDIAAGCDLTTFQPCSDRALASFKVTTDSFRSIYAINSGIAAGRAVSLGRYPEDTYQGGNPWYLTTLAAAEFLYDVILVWVKQAKIDVTDVSLDFFRDLDSQIAPGQYTSNSPQYAVILEKINALAEGYFDNFFKFAPSDGRLAEQFSRENGSPLSAVDLTWSYAGFLTAAARQNGTVPPSWALWSEGVSNTVPQQCAGTSASGPYVIATSTVFPPGQTPPPQRVGEDPTPSIVSVSLAAS